MQLCLHLDVHVFMVICVGARSRLGWSLNSLQREDRCGFSDKLVGLTVYFFSLSYGYIMADGINSNIFSPLTLVGIDGYSRCVVYLKCSNNNRASTVLQLFLDACDVFGTPSHIRCDQGVENLDVGRHMLRVRGLNRGSIITGSSIHNQRIKRLWRDVHRLVVMTFKSIFMYMEEEKILDPLNDVHIFSLHLVYIPRINQALKEFVSQYNDHPIRTEHNSSPRQLFCLGAHALSALEGTDMNPDDHYGVEEEGPVPEL